MDDECSSPLRSLSPPLQSPPLTVAPSATRLNRHLKVVNSETCTLKRNELNEEAYNRVQSPTLSYIPEISSSKIVRTQTERILFSTSQPLKTPLSATHKQYHEDFLLSDLAVWRSDTATMEWRSLDFEWEHQAPPPQIAPPASDWSTDQLIDETLHDGQTFDISELDEYLYPQSSTETAQQDTHTASLPTQQLVPPTFEGTSSSEYVDPLVEFFPELTVAMPPSDQYVSTQSTAFEYRYGDVHGATSVDHSFLETPCRLDTYCKEVSASPCSSEASSYTSPVSRGRRTVNSRTPAPYARDGVNDYREKRDKNNLASQKSREKRRNKVQDLKGECSKLELRNVELKASVDLLEKSVAEYKQIMLSFMKQ